jgi:hypothetical protein
MVHRIEILGHGQQFAAFGVHPRSRKKFKWAGQLNPINTPVKDLPSLNSEEIDSYIQSIEQFLEDQGCEVVHRETSNNIRKNSNSNRIHPDFLKAALSQISADDYDTWITIGMGIHHETNGSTDGLAMWDEWSRSSGKYDESRQNECEYKWHSFGRRPGGITGATVLELAKKEGFNLASFSGPREDLSVDLRNLNSKHIANGSGQLRWHQKSRLLSPPFDLVKPPGLVGMIADYSDRASFRKQPLMNICAGLTTVAALTENRFVVDRWQTPLNMYLVAVAETGEGKEAPRNAIKAAINVVRGLSRVKESVSSSTALLRALAFADRHDIILLLDEFGRLLSVAQKPSNGHLYELVSELMRLYGQANTTNCGKIYANREDNISSINRPFVNVFGTTTKR